MSIKRATELSVSLMSLIPLDMRAAAAKDLAEIIRLSSEHDAALRSLDREGWVSVPKEPTYDMKQVGGAAGIKEQHQAYWEPIAEAIYKAMIAAAPGDTK